MKRDNSSTLAWIDWLLNLLIAFVGLCILLLFQVSNKQSPTKPAVEIRSDFIIKAQWDDFSDDDIDLWVQDPVGSVCGFRLRSVPGMHLQRDDTGRNHKITYKPDGSKIEDPSTFEEINIRRWVPGRYTVNLHLYRNNTNQLLLNPDAVITVKVKVIKVNPLRELPEQLVTFRRQDIGVEKTAISFTLDENGEIAGHDDLPANFIVTTLAKTTPIQSGDRQ